MGRGRVAIELGINHKRARRVMRKYGLCPARRCRSKLRKPLDEGRPAQKAPDILHVYRPIVPDEVWASDFSCFIYRGTKVYMATILDLFTKEVLGALSHSGAHRASV
jgi:hypothetical protein